MSAKVLILLLAFTSLTTLHADIKRLDGTPIRFDTLNSEDIVRISDEGLGINIDATQALHVTGNAIFTGNILSNQFMVLSELASSPATPQSGNGYLYVKNDGKIYFKNDAGTETDLTAGGGGAFSTSSGNAYYSVGYVGVNDSTPTYNLDVNGTFRVTGAATFDSTVSTGALTVTTLDTGQGANELYDMNQNVLTSSAVTFATIDTGQGANELYDMNQNVQTSDAVVFATIDTGQGANELYDMNQNVLTSSSVTFAGITGSGVLSIDDTTNSTSGTTGSIHTDGGLGVVKDVFVTGDILAIGEGSGLIVDSGANRRVGFMKFGGREAGIWRVPNQDFEIGRTQTNLDDDGSATVDYTISGTGYNTFNSGAVINESGADSDTRIEGDTNVNLLYIDASADKIGIGDSTPSYTLDISGTLRATGGVAFDSTLAVGVQNVSSNVTLGSVSLALVDTSSNDVTVTLPAANTEAGRVYRIKKTSTSNTVTLTGSEAIDDSASYTFSSGNIAFISVVSDGSAWKVFSQSSTGLTSSGWTPALLSELDLWLDASDSSSITKDGSGNVSQWNDKSGNSNNATQSGATKHPTSVSAVQNGLDVIRFDGSNDYFDASGLGASNSSMSVFVVVYHDDTGHLDTLLGTDGTWEANSAHVLLVSDKLQYSVDGGGTDDHQPTSTQGDDVWVINSQVNNVTTIDFFKNGSADGSSTSVYGTKDLANFNIGSWDTSRYLHGDIAELLVITNDVSTSDREKIEGYLAHKWGLNGNLPLGHTYKNSAP